MIVDATGTIDYYKGKSLTFSTCAAEKGKVILQLGTADADLALKAALTLKDDVAAIDLNCGCPKKFSVQGGMGAALLSNPDNLCKILTNLVQHSGMPVTCKIRLLETKEKTLDLVRKIVSTGIKALTVHCRTKEQRSTEKPNWEALRDIVDLVKSITDIPVVVNGDVFQYSDIVKAKEVTHADSVMVARGAQWNPSAFRKEGLLPFETVVRVYIKKAIDLNNLFQNTKYVLLSMNTEDTTHTRSELYTKIQRAKEMRTICELFDLTEYYDEAIAKQKANLEKAQASKRDREDDDDTEKPSEKKLKDE